MSHRPFSCPTTETESQYDSTEMNPTDAVLPLCQLPAGSVGRVRQLVGAIDFCQRIREMGLCESAFVAKIGGTGPFLCQINGTRIALSHNAAKCVMVEKLGRR